MYLRSAMILAGVGSVATSFTQATPSTQPSVNRSGEKLLVEILSATHSDRSAAVWIQMDSRESASDPFFTNKSWLFMHDGVKMRAEMSSLWGDGRLYVSDGKVLLEDTLDYSIGATLFDSKPFIWEVAEELKPGRDQAFVFLYLATGPASLKTLAPDDVAVTEIDPDDSLKGVQIANKDFGKMQILFDESSKSKRAVLVTYDNFPLKNRWATEFSEWMSPPLEGSLDQEVIHYLSSTPKQPKAFDPTPVKNLKIDDRRAKKKPL